MKKKTHSKKAIPLIKSQQKCLTKFGGWPNLPESIEWPVSVDGGELDFLAQIHFPEINAKTKLPTTGTLFVFYSNSENWKIIYTEEVLPEAARAPEKKDNTPFLYRESFRKFKTLSSKQCNSAPYHQMLGEPYCIQGNNMYPGHELLLQLDSDWRIDGPGWIWGDAGIIYFFIKPADLNAKRFEKIKAVFECC